MSHQAEHNHENHPDVGHVAPMWILISIFVALLVLTYLTVAVAKIDMGELNIIVAMGIATLKAALVVLFFMHLIWDKPFNVVVFVTSLVCIFLFILFALLDSSNYLPQMIQGYAPEVNK